MSRPRDRALPRCRLAWGLWIAIALSASAGCDSGEKDAKVAVVRAAVTRNVWPGGAANATITFEPVPPATTGPALSSIFTSVSPSANAANTNVGTGTHSGSWAARFTRSGSTVTVEARKTGLNTAACLSGTVKVSLNRRFSGTESSDNWTVSWSGNATATSPAPTWTAITGESQVAGNASGTGSWQTAPLVRTLPATTASTTTPPSIPSSSADFGLSFKAVLSNPSLLDFSTDNMDLDDISLTCDEECLSNSDCNDSNPCTTDACNNFACSHTPLATGSACTTAQLPNGVCNAAATCVECVAASSCNDNNVCTTDTCTGSFTCSHTAVNCSDGLFCNGTETCNTSSGCQAGTPPVVDDGIACTADSCDEAMDRVVHTPVNSACDDGNPCTADVCSATSGCSHDAASMLNQSCPHSPTPWVCNGSGACVQCTQSAQCGGGNNICLFQTCFCGPDTCAKHAGGCGVYPDGCGGTIDCTAACPSGQVCDQSAGPNAGVCIDQCTDHEKDPGEDGRDCGGVCPTPCTESMCTGGVDEDADGFTDCNDIDCVEAGQCDRCSQRLLGHADWPFASTSVAGLGHAPSTLRFTLSAPGCGASLGPVTLSLGSRGTTSYAASDPSFASLIACLKSQWDQRDANAAVQPSVTLTTQFDSVALAKDVPLGALFGYDVATGIIEQLRLVVGYSGYDSVHSAVRLDYRWEALGYFDAKTDCLTCPAFDPQSVTTDFCSSRCACDIGQGGCTKDSDCRRGLICEPRGTWFGYQIPGLSVCVPPSCADGVKGGSETGTDCGGNQCGACPNCALEPSCSPSCPCDDYNGPCSGDADCKAGSACGTGNARRFGKPDMGNVCWPSSCNAPSSCGTPRCGPCAADCSYFPIDCASGSGVTRSEHLAFGTSSLRGTTATYVNADGLVQLVGPHELRVKNGTGGVLSLFEGGRTNYALQSTTPTQWPSTHLTYGSPVPAAPFIASAGLSADVTAVHAVSTGAPPEEYLQQHLVVPQIAGQRVAASAFVRKASGTPQPGAIVINTPSGYGASGFTPSSGWQRVSGVSGAGSSGDFDVFFALGGFGVPQAPSGYDLDLAMPQVELGAFPSSFILSYGGPEKRDVDRVVLDARTVPSWLLSGKYTLEVEPIFGTGDVIAVAQRFVLFEFGAADQWLGFESDGAGKLFLVAQAGSSRTKLELPAFGPGQRFTLTVSPATGDLAASIATSAAHGASWRWPARNVSVGARGEGTVEDAAFAWIGQPTTAPAPAPACSVTPYANGTGCGVGAEWCQAGQCQLSAACGNGVVDRDGISAPIETCDDGNHLPNDGCSPECATEAMSIAPNNVAEDEPGVRTHALGVDDRGRLLFVWQSDEAESSRLLARRATAAGVTVDSDLAPIEIASDLGLKWPAEPAVVGLTGGGWAVVWVDSQQSGDAARVVFRLVAEDGTLSAPFTVTDAASAPSNQHQTSVRAAPLRSGFVAAWVDQRLVQSGADSSSVRARLFDVHGAPASPELAIADAPGDTALEPALAALGTQWIAAWSRGDDLSLRARRFDGATPLGSELLVAADARSPALTALLPAAVQADFALAWTGASDQRVRVLELLGTDTAPSAPQFAFEAPDGRPELYPELAPLGEDAFAVGFDYGDGFRDAAVRVIPRAGHLYSTQPDEGALSAMLQGSSNQRNLALTPAQNGVWCTWTDDGVQPDGSGALPNRERAFLLGCPSCQLAAGPACFEQGTKITPPDLGSQPRVSGYPDFGVPVKISGDRLLIGAAHDYTAGAHEGAAFLYRWVDGQWVEDKKLLASDAAPPPPSAPDGGAHFGFAAAIDQDEFIVGSPFRADAAGAERGSAYIYELSGSQWVETKLKPPQQGDGQWFGYAVAIRGKWALVGAVLDSQQRTQGGAVYVYRRDPGGWTFAQKLVSADPSNETEFGLAVGLATDSLLVSTLTGDPADQANVNAAVYAFRYQNGAWVQTQRLSTLDQQPLDFFGSIWSVAVDGDTAVIGAYYHTDEHPGDGAAYVLQDVGGSWTQIAKLHPDDLGWGSNFGTATAVLGSTVAVTAGGYGAANEGNNPTPPAPRVYVYEHDTLHDAWNLVRRLDDPSVGGSPQDFGAALAIGRETLVVGADNAPDAAYQDLPGAFYSFSCFATATCGDGWVEASEDCDDGNRVTESCPVANQSCQVCGADCHFAYPTCGDGIVQGPAENCDDGNAVTEYCADFAPCTTCTASCTLDSGKFCGDGIVDLANGEQCDDGNHLDGDGCSHMCRLECVRIATTDTTCDGVDDDCDGTVDDDFAPQPTSCGLGTCARTGQIQCVSGKLTTNCSPGAPSGGDTVCDGINDDCDVSTDEGYVTQASTCGVGVCQRMGQRTCLSGAIADSCVPGSPTGSDANCNGLDENCNGQTDENYAPVPVSCGQGVCRATTNTRCVNGSVDSSCTPLPPLASLDFTCDAKDDDCDGINDDDYVRPNVSCGTGACRVTVQASCVNGSVSSSCTPLSPPSQTDTSCDGVDNNCNGSTDEGYVSTSTVCGIGACQRNGSTSCASGVVKDSCTPGAPALDDYACDGKDDDCDGTNDEDCTCNQPLPVSVSAEVTAGRAYRQDQSCGTTPVTLLSDGFEATTFNAAWTRTGSISISTTSPHTGSRDADFAKPSSGTLSTMRASFNVSGMSNIKLTYWRRSSWTSLTSTTDNLLVRYSTDNGSTWTQIEKTSGAFNSWGSTTFNITATSSLLISFETTISTALSARHIYLDDVSLTATTPCLTPTWFATGSNEPLGTDPNAIVTLYALQSAPSIWHVGACPICGNGTLQNGEACDDGNRVNEYCGTSSCQICNYHCQLVAGGICGDGVVQSPQEQCDDGNTIDTDGCKNNCTLPCSATCGWGCQNNTCLQPVQLSSAQYDSCAALSDGRMACWGNGSNPTFVAGFTNVTRVVAGNVITCGLLSDRTVRCTGQDGRGQLGDGPGTGGPVLGLNDAVSLGAGQGYGCAARANGQVVCWGQNDYGQLGDGTTTDRDAPVTVPGIADAVAVGIGPWHACALLSDQTVRCWGRNDYGQTGDGTTAPRLLPVKAQGVSSVVQVSVGVTFTCARKTDGTVWCWGNNGSGGLGNGVSASLTPVQVTGINDAVDVSMFAAHACVLRASGQVSCWGFNEHGQLGNGNTASTPSPSTVANLAAKAVSVGWEHTCAITTAGAVVCWGGNEYKEIGDGSFVDTSSPQSVVGLSDAVSVSSGAVHTCALRATGGVMCWGNNAYGQLGDQTMQDQAAPVAVQGLSGIAQVGPGYQYTCARRTSGQATCWGTMTGYPNGAAFSATPVDLPAVTDAIDLGPAYVESCAIRNNGHVVCWGYDDGFGGRAPTEVAGVTDGRSAAVSGVSCVVRANGHIACFGHNENGYLGDGTTTTRYTFGDVSGISDALKVGVGPYHSCALRSGGRVSCWGLNGSGQLGNGQQAPFSTVPVDAVGINDAIDVSVGVYSSCAVRSTGGLMCWGNMSSPTPAPVAGIADATQVSMGGFHLCVRRSGGGVQCWGRNVEGEVGVGAFPYSKVPVKVLLPN